MEFAGDISDVGGNAAWLAEPAEQVFPNIFS
jgi:hypothetical protein